MVCHTGMDHHCLFLYKCIAQNNHRHFIRFIMLVVFAMLLFEHQAFRYLVNLYPGFIDAPTDYIAKIFGENPWMCSLMIANALSALWAMLLLRFQFKFIAVGTTQYFQMSVKPKSQLSFGQKIHNVVNFLLGKKYYAKDTESGVMLL